jgi:hypothetical protein
MTKSQGTKKGLILLGSPKFGRHLGPTFTHLPVLPPLPTCMYTPAMQHCQALLKRFGLMNRLLQPRSVVDVSRRQRFGGGSATLHQHPCPFVDLSASESPLWTMECRAGIFSQFGVTDEITDDRDPFSTSCNCRAPVTMLGPLHIDYINVWHFVLVHRQRKHTSFSPPKGTSTFPKLLVLLSYYLPRSFSSGSV